MGESVSVREMVAKINEVQKRLDSKPLNAAAFKAIGDELAPLARAAAAGLKLGSDAAFTRGSVGRARQWFNVPLEARASVHRSGRGVTIGRTRASAGPWRVAEDGRAAYTKGAKIQQGTFRSGRARMVKARNTSTATEGFGAWSSAEALMAAAAPAKMPTHFTKSIVEVFR